jgi:hypothetical protein
VRLWCAADLDDFLDMSIENFTVILDPSLYAQIMDISGLRPNCNSNLLHISVNYIEKET